MTGCVGNVIDNNGISGNNGNGQEAEKNMFDKYLFLRFFRFYTNHPNDTTPSQSDLINYSDIVFVLDESEQVNYPKDVLVAWPGTNTERVLWSVNYYAICGEGADPTPYGLAYPITMTDVVDQWESYYDFVMSLDSSLHSYVMSPSHGYAEEDEGWYPLPDLGSCPS